MNEMMEGSSRNVFREGAWVRKVEKEEGAEYACNLLEIEAYANLISSGMLPDGVRVPETDLLPDGSIRMRYVEGTPAGKCMCSRFVAEECTKHCLTTAEVALVEGLIPDIYGFNVIRDIAGVLWLIDLAP